MSTHEPVKRYDVGGCDSDPGYAVPMEETEDGEFVPFIIYDRDIKAARFAPLGDNHHNAAECPYCNPKYHEQIKTIERLEAILREAQKYLTAAQLVAMQTALEEKT